MKWLRRRLAGRDESGAALVLVLIVITVIAVALGALLTFADTSERTTVNLRSQTASAYDADGALQAAINNIRNSNFSGATGQHCFGGSDTLSLPNFSGADSAAVTCTADPAKVLIQCTSLTQCNRPGNAILTLGNVPGEDGINIQQPTGSTFRVHGVVFSNSNLNVVNGALNTNTAVYARTGCSGTVQSSPAPVCNYSDTKLGADPGYASDLTSVPPHRSLPACTKAGSLITFQPGYYDDAAGLSTMMSSSSKCKDSTWWFPPGSYYFDFHNSAAVRPPSLPSGSDLWTVDNGTLVAGTPMSGGKVVATPPVPAAIPASCDNPINDANAKGVQFVFGGDSQLAVKSGQAEICGTYSATKPPIALYGLTSGAESPASPTLTASAVPSPGEFIGATPDSLSKADGLAALWTSKGKGKNSSTTLVANGFAAPTTPPEGSLLTSAKLVVAHGKTDAKVSDTLSAVLTPTGASPINVTVPSYSDTATHTDTTTIAGSDFGALADLVYQGKFTGAQVSYTASVKDIVTENLDALQLVLTYTPPALRAQNGCTTAGPYPRTGCATVSSVNNSGNRFYVQGTTYTPKAVLDIALNNDIEPIFRFGVIARSLWVKETGSVAFTGVIIEVPDDSPGFVFGVYLSAYVCQSSPTCSPSGTAAARARVAYVDGDPANPTPGARQVSVLSWSGSR